LTTDFIGFTFYISPLKYSGLSEDVSLLHLGQNFNDTFRGIGSGGDNEEHRECEPVKHGNPNRHYQSNLQ